MKGRSDVAPSSSFQWGHTHSSVLAHPSRYHAIVVGVDCRVTSVSLWMDTLSSAVTYRLGAPRSDLTSPHLHPHPHPHTHRLSLVSYPLQVTCACVHISTRFTAHSLPRPSPPLLAS